MDNQSRAKLKALLLEVDALLLDIPLLPNQLLTAHELNIITRNLQSVRATILKRFFSNESNKPSEASQNLPRA